jgi:hypothetical protein
MKWLPGIIFQILAIQAYSQNLVYNGSFEELYPNPAKRCFSTNVNTEGIYASTSNVYALMKPDMEDKIRQDICLNYVANGLSRHVYIEMNSGNSGLTTLPKYAADGKRFVTVHLWEESGSGNNWAGMWLRGAIGMEMQELQIGRRYRFLAKFTAGPGILSQCDYDGFGVAFSCNYMHDAYSPDGSLWRYVDLLDSVFHTKDSLVLSHYGRFFRYPGTVNPGPWKQFTFEFTADSAYRWLALGRIMVPLGLADKCKTVPEHAGHYHMDDVRVELLDREPKIEGPAEICAGDSLLLRNANGDTVYFEAEPIRRFPVQWLDAEGNLLDSSVNLRGKTCRFYLVCGALCHGNRYPLGAGKPQTGTRLPDLFARLPERQHSAPLRRQQPKLHLSLGAPDIEARQLVHPDTGKLKLIISNAFGCVDSFWILPEDSCGFLRALYIPNAIYPASGHNNTSLEISHPAIESLELNIYNRWGAKIASLEGRHRVNWIPGEEIMEGVYVWRCTATYRNPQQQLQTSYLHGTVHVLR